MDEIRKEKQEQSWKKLMERSSNRIKELKKRGLIESLDRTVGAGRTLQDDVDQGHEFDATDDELEEEGGG